MFPQARGGSRSTSDQTPWRAAIFTLDDGNWIRCFKDSARFADTRDLAMRDIYSLQFRIQITVKIE